MYRSPRVYKLSVCKYVNKVFNSNLIAWPHDRSAVSHWFFKTIFIRKEDFSQQKRKLNYYIIYWQWRESLPVNQTFGRYRRWKESQWNTSWAFQCGSCACKGVVCNYCRWWPCRICVEMGSCTCNPYIVILRRNNNKSRLRIPPFQNRRCVWYPVSSSHFQDTRFCSVQESGGSVQPKIWDV